MKNFQKDIKKKRDRRHKRVRAKIKGTNMRPRLSVFRSNTHISCQLINDNEGKTIINADDKEIKEKGKKTDIAFEVGKLIAKKGKEKGIEKVVFDRGYYRYHGRVKALAEGARKGGLQF
ncbi:MAG TPA: 50S ribosomal protein L18 [Candidatus Pacearchaeota archaeon]|nr:50S ribosomal protein L18 [Candidatus Pacearchaeota archaeon]